VRLEDKTDTILSDGDVFFVILILRLSLCRRAWHRLRFCLEVNTDIL